MTLEELSKKILDGEFDEEIDHSDEDPAETESVDEETQPTDEPDSLTHYSVQFTDESDSLEHYGVLGMKWGVRKDRKVRRRDRRYEGESDQEYQNRMQRESAERIAKTQAKQNVQTQKRMLKSQERMQKLKLKTEQRQKELDIEERRRKEKEERQAKLQKLKEEKALSKKAEREKTNSKPSNARKLTDRELNDAIQRLRNEQVYKELALENKTFFKRNASKAIKIGGGILLTVGTAVATQQLKKVGNQKAEDFLIKKKLLKPEPEKGKGGVSKSDVQNIVLETIQELMANGG